MPIKEKISATQFWSFLFKNMKTILAIPTFMSLLLLGVWKLYGEDKVEEKIKFEIAPLRTTVEVHTVQIDQMAFESKQNNLILKEIASPDVVRKVERMTEIFRPLKSGESVD